MPAGVQAASPRVRGALGVLAALLLLAGAVDLVADTPVLLLGLALAPAALLAALLVWLDRPRRVPRRFWLGTFLWGAAVAPVIAALLNGALRDWLGGVTDAAAATAWSARLGAPLIEEAAKAAALAGLVLVWRDAVRDALDGVILGALVGLGFTVAENCYYFALAALGGPLHALFTASAGAGLGAARTLRGAARVAAPLAGLVLAVAQHAAWNAAGATWLDTAACAPGAATACALDGRLRYWAFTAPAIVALFVAPGLLALAWLRRRALARRAAQAVK
jgi:RsiW-degrading membrane proteinase PrsW (M82 family)